MNDPKSVSVATDKLREYAEFLSAGEVREPTASRRPTSADNSCAHRIRALIAEVEQGKIPVEAWGVPAGWIDYGPDVGDLPRLRSTHEAPEHYVNFKNAYEAAHQALVVRLRSLADVYDAAGNAYRETARAYDIMDTTYTD